MDVPDQKGRLEILKVHARNKKLGADIDLKEIALRTPGFSGASGVGGGCLDPGIRDASREGSVRPRVLGAWGGPPALRTPGVSGA